MHDYENQQEWELEAGHMQSPINIKEEESIQKKHEDIGINIASKQYKTVKTQCGMKYELTGTINLLDRSFRADHIHFHTGSEHRFNGKELLIEAHIVSFSEIDRIAVLGILFEIGNHNPEFNNLLLSIKDKSVNINVNNLLPSSKDYYHYLGSLTTPPLTENVEWYVFSEPTTISEEQFEEYLEVFPNKNNRNVQPQNNRKVIHFKKEE